MKTKTRKDQRNKEIYSISKNIVLSVLKNNKLTFNKPFKDQNDRLQNCIYQIKFLKEQEIEKYFYSISSENRNGFNKKYAEKDFDQYIDEIFNNYTDKMKKHTEKYERKRIKT